MQEYRLFEFELAWRKGGITDGSVDTDEVA